VTTAAGFLFAAFPVSVAALVMTHSGDNQAAAGLRQALTVGCSFLLAAVGVALTLVPLTVRVWREKYWGAARRTYFTILAVGALIAAPLLLHYHLLGFWF
jgi:hypothetical protein